MARTYRLLGALEIEENGRPSRLMNSAKGCALVAYLIVTGQPQSREALADLLWDADTSGRSMGNFRSLLNRVRKLAPELSITSQSAVFQPGPDTEVDLIRLIEALASDNMDLQDDCLRLYRGDLLSGLYVSDAPRFEEWLLLSQERLRLRVLVAYEELCRAFLKGGQLNRALDVARRWSALDPLDEEALRHLLTLLALNGLTGSALQQYETSRQIIWRELNLEPEPATQALIEQIRIGELTRVQTFAAESPPPQASEPLLFSDETGADVDSSKPEQESTVGHSMETAGSTLNSDPIKSAGLSEPGPLPPNSMLPYHRNEDFVGRRTELQHIALTLAEARESGRRPVAAITGIGGLGKTQTAVEFCFRYGRYFPGGVFWLNFGQPQSVAGAVAAIGSERGLRLFRDSDRLSMADQTRLVQRALQEPVHRLLIFDNCEDPALLESWLPVTGGCHVLLTSRQGYWPRGLDITIISLDTLEPSESSRLLRRLASHVSEAEAEAISREVGYLPLALQLAGGFLSQYRRVTPAAYLEQLQHHGLLQHPSMQGRGALQSSADKKFSLTRMFSNSWNQLDLSNQVDSVARQLLACAASLAPGEPFPAELLQATIHGKADELAAILLAEDGLLRLVNLGLLRRSGDMVVLHRLLALFTREANTEEENRRALSQVAQLLAHRLSAYHQREGHFSTLPVSASHLDYVTSRALAEALPNAAALATIFGIHLTQIGAYLDAEQLLLKAIAVAKDSNDLRTLAQALSALSNTRENMGYYETSLQSAQEAVSAYKKLDSVDPAGLAEALYQQGRVHHRLEQAKAALGAAEEGYALSQAANLDQARAKFLDLMGVVNYYNLGLYEVAQGQLEESLVICRQLGNRQAEGSVLNHLGEIARLQGDYAVAARYYEDALAIARQIDNQSQANLFLSNLCGARIGLRQFEEAAADLEALIAGIQYDWFGLSEACRFLGEAYLGQGKKNLAYDAAQRALASANEFNLVEVSRAWRTLGKVAAQVGDFIQPIPQEDHPYDAGACFERSLELLKTGNVDRDRAITIWYWGQYERGWGNKQQGEAMVEEAREIFSRLNLPQMITRLEAVTTSSK